MKITRKQLKRIIAEEHAVVYGTKKRTTRRPQGRRKTTKKVYVNEAKRAMINEIQIRAITNELMTEGMFGDMWDSAKSWIGSAADVAGEEGKKAIGAIGKKAQGMAQAAAEMASSSKDYVQGLAKAGNEKLAKVAEKQAERMKQIIAKKVEEMTDELVAQIKKINPDFDEEEIKGITSAVITPALASNLGETIKGKKGQRLLEAKSRKKALSAKKRRVVRNRRRR